MDTSQMRAVLVKGGKGGIDNLDLGAIPKPTASPSHVLVKVCYRFT